VEKEQFVSLMKEHRNLIFKICHSYCANAENRKDLQQEIFIQLWKSFKKFDGRVKFSTWIYKVALNTAIFYYRKDSKHNNSKTVSLDAELITLTSHEPEADENIILLYKFIGQLNDLDKALILLYLDDNKQKDIAEILGLSETNVATKISRIKKNLKEQFKA
jgi:RNA polymerase sigma factor (sigma-70 family)